MHELGYCEALLPVVEARASGRAVTAIGIRAGVRHRLVADVMQMAWQLAAAETPYAAATTVVDQVAMTGTCRQCGHRFPTDDTLADCPHCAAIGPALTGGDEFVLDWLQYEGSHRVPAGAAVADPPGHDHHDHPHEQEH